MISFSRILQRQPYTIVTLMLLIPVAIYAVVYAQSGMTTVDSPPTTETPPSDTGFCFVRNDYTSSPAINDPDLGTGYAKMIKPGVTTVEGIHAACSREDFNVLLQSYCTRNSAPVYAQVWVAGTSGCSIVTGCNRLSCASLSPTALPSDTGFCVVRNNHTSLPSLYDPDLGTGYAKMVKPGITTIDGIKAACSREDFNVLLQSYCTRNSDPVQAGVSAGTTSTCGVVGCNPLSCASASSTNTSTATTPISSIPQTATSALLPVAQPSSSSVGTSSPTSSSATSALLPVAQPSSSPTRTSSPTLPSAPLPSTGTPSKSLAPSLSSPTLGPQPPQILDLQSSKKISPFVTLKPLQIRALTSRKNRMLREIKAIEEFYMHAKNADVLDEIADLQERLNAFQPTDMSAYDTARDFYDELKDLRPKKARNR